jgi:hypothetical protein
MRRGIVFIVQGIPRDYRVSDPKYFMANPAADVVKALRKDAEKHAHLRNLSQLLAGTDLVFAGFCNELQDQGEAVGAAYERLSGIIDGLSLLLDELPRVAEIVLVREEDSPDLKMLGYSDHGWANFLPTKTDSAEAWKRRTQQLRDCLLQFFDLWTAGGPEAATDLGRQIRYSVKMYRHGVQARAWGVEYVCKFSALEGLVCGPATSHKSQLLRQRLPALFRDPSLEAQVERLWDLRCDASHQAKAFYSDSFPDAEPLQMHIGLLDQLFTGALVFALDNLQKQSVPQLWASVASYRMPPYAAQVRPADMHRIPALRLTLDLHLRWPGMGESFGACFKANEEAHKTAKQRIGSAGGCGRQATSSAEHPASEGCPPFPFDAPPAPRYGPVRHE